MSLLELTVTDLALIERARVTLRPGFTVITGETGAGKSLLIDALGLVMGGRSDAGLVRQGASAARVEALFERDPEPLICVRDVAAGGRTVARIDDETVTVARLAAVVAPLVEVHGQHDQQRLLSAAWQRELLDAYGDLAPLRSAVREAVEALRSNEAALRELAMSPDELERRLDLAEHAAAEIDAAAPKTGEVEALRARQTAAANSERIARLFGSALERLDGEGAGARDMLVSAARDVTELARLDPRLEATSERLNGLAVEVEDVTADLLRATDASETDRSALAAIEERLSLLYGLLRKYGNSEAIVLEHRDAARSEVDRLRSLGTERAQRETEAKRLQAMAADAAEALSASRRSTAARLGPLVTGALLELGFSGAAFAVDVDPSELDTSGADAVTFMLAPNPGEPSRPLARIASGGELSRVALAVKGVLAKADTTPTLVFDEVDAGIGGRSGDPVGRSLWRLARDHQVLCVTHLPQIAAYADAHLHIAKVRRDGRTVTHIRELDAAERVGELAQMLGGESSGGAARATASELLSGAAGLRDEVAGSRP
ncbi:MAG: DNA repair protein RecN [Chloroflexota bacterium]|nr:DNA repair protein RecN [Chloroflexota bacterium]